MRGQLGVFNLRVPATLPIRVKWAFTLDKCDLNFISVKEMNSVEYICGTPGTIDTPADTKCRIRAIVSPSPENHGKLYKVLEVLTIDKG
jgi:hypothetical protein